MSELSSHLKVVFLVLVTTKLLSGIERCFTMLMRKMIWTCFGTSKRIDVYDDLPGWPLYVTVIELAIVQEDKLPLPEVILNSRNLLEWAAQKTLLHGVGYSVTMPGLRLIEITRPDWIEHVQKSMFFTCRNHCPANFQNYVKGSLFQEVMSDVFGQGIFVTDGAAWKSTRQTTARIFNANNFNVCRLSKDEKTRADNIITPAVHKTLGSFMEVLAFHSETQTPVEMDTLLHQFTLESFIKMTFSQDMGGLKARLSGQHTEPFAEAFDYVQKQLDLRFIMTAIWLRLGRFVGSRPKMVAARRTLENYAYELIDSREANPNKKTEVYHDLLGLFMSFTDEKGVSMSRSELKDSALNLIIAGRDTTAQALSWTFFHLIRNPEVVAKMRVEIDQLMASNDELVDYTNYKQFTYNLAVFYEALRLHPSVPKASFFQSHKTIEATAVSISYLKKCDCINLRRMPNLRLIMIKSQMDPWSSPGIVCAGVISMWFLMCCTIFFLLHFLPYEVTGRWPEILAFGGLIAPSSNRLVGSTITEPYVNLGNGSFTHSMSGGPRVCIGMHLGTLEAVACLVQVVRTFDLEFEPGWFEKVPKIRKISPKSTEQTPRYASSLTLPMANHMRILVQKRQA
ncbi:hypothetical protein VP01_278g6 [Puccinia sorghi]|uniref:Cytochrome P450 n=1 Tax=Puccinia sorghi TaxID=27349 RepID=A0A0L6V2P3_9BASI|nr:hypothetical protein VP01_278g6 [Puccinia sorghi]